MKNILSGLGIVALIVLAIVLVGVGPVLTILSLNALFNTGIAITIANWFAVLWLCIVLGGVKFSKSN